MLTKDISADYTPLVDCDDMMTLGDAARMFGVREKTIIWWLKATNMEEKIKTAGRRKIVRLGDIIISLNGSEMEGKTMVRLTELPEMITVAEAAKRTDISSYSIRRWAAEKKIKCVKSGCKMYIHFQSLILFLENGEEGKNNAAI